MFDWILAIIVFVFVKYWSMYIASGVVKKWCAKVFCFIGPLTFGVYLFDPRLKSFFCSDYLLYTEPALPAMIVSIGWVLISMTAGGIITCAFKKTLHPRKMIQ